MHEPIYLTLTSEEILEKYFAGLHSGGGKSHIRGGQTAANEALAELDITRYASTTKNIPFAFSFEAKQHHNVR